MKNIHYSQFPGSLEIWTQHSDATGLGREKDVLEEEQTGNLRPGKALEMSPEGSRADMYSQVEDLGAASIYHWALV